MKKLVTLALLVGVSQSAKGMELAKTLPQNSVIFSENFKAADFNLELGLQLPEYKPMFQDTYHNSCYIQTNHEGKISKVHLSPVVTALQNILEAKYTNELVTLRAFKQTCEANHKDYAQAQAAQTKLNAQTWRNRLPNVNAFLSFGLGAGLMAAWNKGIPFESLALKFPLLSRMANIFTKAAASAPTNS